MNKELKALFEQDQADRRAFDQLDHEQIQQMLQRDRERRQRVEELIGREAWQAEELNQSRELARQGIPQAQGPKRLASLEVPGLSVEIIAFDDVFVRQVPDQDRPAREELPAPDNFPAGWMLYRLGEGYVATAADGQEIINGFKVPESKLSYACREEEVPQLEAIQLGDRPAILLRSADASFTQLFMRSGDAYYMVGGQVALNELLQIATSIPHSQL